MSETRGSSIDHLRLRSLVLLTTLAEAGSLHQAARRMNTSQPALTVMLREMERTLGGKLFERTPHGLTLTDAGAYAVRQAELTLADLGRLQREVLSNNIGRTLLRVGALPLFMLEIVPRALGRLHAEHHGSRMEFHEDAAPELLQALCGGELDLVLGRMLPEFAQRDDLDASLLFTETFCVIASRRHPLADRRRIRWTELQAQRWVQAPPNTLLHDQFADVFIARGLQPPAADYESASFHSCIAIIRAVDALMLVPREVGRYFSLRGDVAILPIDVGRVSGGLSIISRKGRAQTDTRATFVSAIRDVLTARAQEM